MRANPHLLRGANKLWIRFFLLAVYATMYVRDHQRPYMHEAFGIDPTDYDYKVFSITSACTKQVFPFTLDTDSKSFRELLERLRLQMEKAETGKKRGGLIGTLQRGAAAIGVASLFVRLYLQPVIEHELPENVRMAPAW
jgi:magnesium-protoporphyrin IX monomethyl ester (oxidative) cyclase